MSDFLTRGPFALFGLPEAYRIDLDDLEQRYRQLQRAVHPDRHATSGAHERRMAMQMTARLNEAFAALRSPLERARLLLERRGRAIEDNPSGLPPELLFEQIEIREEIERLRASGDRVALAAVRDRLRSRAHDIERRLGERLDAPETDEAGLEEAVMACYELQFIDRVLAGFDDPRWDVDRGLAGRDGDGER